MLQSIKATLSSGGIRLRVSAKNDEPSAGVITRTRKGGIFDVCVSGLSSQP